PRALGMRSILARPDVENMRDRLNMVIKKREIFRPFAPAVLKQEAANWFDDIDDHMSPYMTSIARIKADKADKVPACVHVDGSCRAQTVDEQSSPAMYQVLTHMQQQTGTPIVINTSL